MPGHVIGMTSELHVTPGCPFGRPGLRPGRSAQDAASRQFRSQAPARGCGELRRVLEKIP